MALRTPHRRLVAAAFATLVAAACTESEMLNLDRISAREGGAVDGTIGSGGAADAGGNIGGGSSGGGGGSSAGGTGGAIRDAGALDGHADATAGEVGQVLTYAKDIAPLLDAACGGLNGCHGAGAGAGNLTLDYAGLMDMASGATANCTGLDPSKRRVVPMKPDGSLLYIKIKGTPPQSCGSRMPEGRPAMSATQVATVRSWILDGAQP